MTAQDILNNFLKWLIEDVATRKGKSATFPVRYCKLCKAQEFTIFCDEQLMGTKDACIFEERQVEKV